MILNNTSPAHAEQCVNRVSPLFYAASDWCIEHMNDVADDSDAEETVETMATEDADSEDDSDDSEGGHTTVRVTESIHRQPSG
jgi:hypothetical protein